MGKKGKGWVPFQKKSNRKLFKSHMPMRLDFLFFIVFILFTILIVRLSDLQIKDQEKYQEMVDNNQSKIVSEPAPRGYIYDSKGTLLVSNQANQAILFTRGIGMSAPDIKKVSEQIVEIISIPEETLSERDKKDYWLADPENLEKAQDRLTPQDKVDDKGAPISNGLLYSNTVDKVTEEEIEMDDLELKKAIVFKKINEAGELQTVTIKNEDVTIDEIARVGENISTIPGLITGMDWEREYPDKAQIRSILGRVSSEKQGLPEDEIDSYLAKGYDLNDRVGLSYLEKAYEDDLRGLKGESEVETDKNQNILSKREITPSQKGNNLKLTLDLEFQNKVEEIAKRNYESLIDAGKAEYSPGVYVVATNPQNGAILSMVGLERDDKGELVDDALGTINKAFVPGSSIKAATIMAGYENGVISGNETLIDEPMVFGNGQIKSSLFNQSSSVPLTTVDALAVSSNVYMMKIALGLVGSSYSNGMNLPLDVSVFDKLRATYEEFGLGTETGIDIPGESIGVLNKNYTDAEGNYIEGIMGNALDLSFGNYEAYTPLQLAQYVSTVANGGKRIAPHIVEGVYDNSETGELGNVVRTIEPKIMSQIEGKEEEFDILQRGFYEVVYNNGLGTATSLQDSPLTIAAKTGTAETFAVDPDTGEVETVINSTIVGYAPYDNPEIAVSVVVPQIKDNSTGVSTRILKEVIAAYDDIYNSDASED